MEINNGLIICFVCAINANIQITLPITYSTQIVTSTFIGMNDNWNLTYSSHIVDLANIFGNAKQFHGATFNPGTCSLLTFGY